MTKALVTGATGFLGRHTLRRLTELGWEVSGLGRNREIGSQFAKEGAAFICEDLRNLDAVVRACAGQDYVFHCGALSSPWGKYNDFYSCNVTATHNIIEGCQHHGVRRLIHISTPSIYFNFKNRYGIQENDLVPVKPANAYVATKRLAELAVEQAGTEGLEAIILRPRAIFGPMDNALFPRILQANIGKGVPLLDGGETLIDLTYVDNVVDAMLLSCSASASAVGRTYNISNGESVIFRELVSKLFALLNIPLHTRVLPYRLAYRAANVLEVLHRLLPLLGEPALTRYSVGTLALAHTLDISLAREMLGYEPRVTIAEGLQLFADWWREQS
ncbi:NAD-dependent epimerase/dehydratase family protein [Paenibacillus sp. 19GGS1-52]|uniref:NAD-dependent epimerase/dehydratase family protein n=1 Tax=Paenibacillus sp. 19GGS1-52 TaxID=2758563 RepID=UPI001EFA2F08|nr:NAD-dependent epimerase/dehydratase family protein [Paenibacillus sp. 19GGS1-52]ULO05576.1 NAD-dependent epimerase/dehydratase family protein [Paenibacillus sp. 19GGS1-52]